MSAWKAEFAENVLLKIIGQNWWFGLSVVQIYWINIKASPQTFEDYFCCSTKSFALMRRLVGGIILLNFLDSSKGKMAF